MSKILIFAIPNNDNGGAQNFFKKLFKNIDYDKKILLIENDKTFFKNLTLVGKKFLKNDVHFFTTVNSNFLGLIAKLIFFRIRLYSRLGNTISQEISKHSLKYYVHKIFYFCLSFFSQNIIFQSNVMKNDFISFFGFSDKDKYIVIFNAIEPTTYESIHRVKSNTHLCKILLVGTMKFQKGYDIFVDSVSKIPSKKRLNLQFDVLGDGPDFEDIASSINEKGLSDCINLHGNTNPYNYYLNTDLYILPSRWEGFSNSLIEALSFGIPALVSDCPSGNREVIIEGFNGIFFQNLSSQDLRDKILETIANLDSFDRFSISCDTNDRFSIRSISNTYLSLVN